MGQCDTDFEFIQGSCYWSADISALSDIITQNNLPFDILECGGQNWVDGRLTYLEMPFMEITIIPPSIGNLT